MQKRKPFDQWTWIQDLGSYAPVKRMKKKNEIIRVDGEHFIQIDEAIGTRQSTSK